MFHFVEIQIPNSCLGLFSDEHRSDAMLEHYSRQREREMDTYNTHATCDKGRGLISIRSHLEEFDIVCVSTLEGCTSAPSWSHQSSDSINVIFGSRL